MTAYLFVIRDEPVRDEAAMAEYQRMNRENKSEHPLTPLVIYGKTEAVEGPAPDGVILLSFPTVDDAWAWYNSPGYQAALPHRKQAADYRVFVVEGV